MTKMKYGFDSRRLDNGDAAVFIHKETTDDDPSKIGTGAIKYDSGKAPVYRGFISYFPRAIKAVAEVSGFGAVKYAYEGWADISDGFNRYKDAQFRHILEHAKGQHTAEDSRLAHLAHEAWGAMATLELYLRETENAVH